MRLVILARLIRGIPQSLSLYPCVHLSHSPSGFQTSLLWMVPSNFIKLQRQHPAVQTAACFPQCLHKVGERWKVKSLKALPVNEGCVQWWHVVATQLQWIPLCPLPCYWNCIDASGHCCWFLKLNEQMNQWWGIGRLEKAKWCEHLLCCPDAETSNWSQFQTKTQKKKC